MNTTQQITFFDVLTKLEPFLTKYTQDPLESIELVTKNFYQDYREKIANCFFLESGVEQFTQTISDDTERGDIATAAYDTIMLLFPPEKTKRADILSTEMRENFRENMLKAMDNAATS